MNTNRHETRPMRRSFWSAPAQRRFGSNGQSAQPLHELRSEEAHFQLGIRNSEFGIGQSLLTTKFMEWLRALAIQFIAPLRGRTPKASPYQAGFVSIRVHSWLPTAAVRPRVKNLALKLLSNFLTFFERCAGSGFLTL